MSELIKGLVQVRDGLSLIAFMTIVLLLAFRTKKVPELFFGLVRDKLTRQQFSALLHRFMILGLIAFLASASLAVLSEVLNQRTQPSTLTVADLRRELANVTASVEQKIHAEAQFNLGMDKLNLRDFDGAIASLQESIRAIPTLTAQEMLTYLFRQKGDFANASVAWEAAMKTAQERGDTLALVRLDNNSVPHSIPNPEGEHDLIGNSTPLPAGGDRFETAATIPTGFFNCPESGCSGWFKLKLAAGQSLDIKFRSPPLGGLAGAGLYGTNGETLKGAGDPPNAMRGNAGPGSTLYRLDWIARASGWHFLRIGADGGAVYRIQIQ
jgi:hypothetical protein